MQHMISTACLLFASLLIVASAAADEPEFRPIFDGKTLDGWDGDPRLWRVADGVIVGETTAGNPAEKNTFLIWRGGRPGDFVLKLEFKLTNHNSGVQFRSREAPGGKWAVGGYQADFDGAGRWVGALYEERGRGVLARRGQKVAVGEDHKPRVTGSLGDPAKLLAGYKKNGWNGYEIIARGNRIVQKLNGRTTVELTDNDPAKRRFKGIIALQLHAGPPMKVQFRNIRLKEFSASEKSEPTNE